MVQYFGYFVAVWVFPAVLLPHCVCHFIWVDILVCNHRRSGGTVNSIRRSDVLHVGFEMYSFGVLDWVMDDALLIGSDILNIVT